MSPVARVATNCLFDSSVERKSKDFEAGRVKLHPISVYHLPPSPFRKKKNKDTLIRDSSDNFGYNCQAEIKLRASMLRFLFQFFTFPPKTGPLSRSRALSNEKKKRKKIEDRVSIRNYHRVIRTRDKSRLFNLNANERRLKGGTYLRIAFQELAFLRTRSKGGRKRRKGREREENRKGKR